MVENRERKWQKNRKKWCAKKWRKRTYFEEKMAKNEENPNGKCLKIWENGPKIAKI